MCSFFPQKTKHKGVMTLTQATVVTMHNKRPFGFSILQHVDLECSELFKSHELPSSLKNSVSTSSYFKRSESTPSSFNSLEHSPSSSLTIFKNYEATSSTYKNSLELTRSCFKKPTTSHSSFTLLAQSEEERYQWVVVIRANLRALYSCQSPDHSNH
jgi:hypothetical protein